MEENRLSELAEKYLNKTISPEEEAELHAWWDQETNDEEEQIVITAQPETYDRVKDRILDGLNRKIDAERAPARLRRIDRRWLVAASIILIAATTAIIIPLSRKQPAIPGDAPIDAARAIKPGGNKATLELADGRTFRLDSVKQGLVTSESGTKITKTGTDLLSYSASGNAKPTYNIVHTPKGGQYRVTLPDGSNVWLDAASSIRFPTAFEGKQRLVELSGEAYFEVRDDPGHPFKVVVSPNPGSPSCEITVLGTHFDINSYPDEKSIRTTLFSGSLRVTSSQTNRAEVLKPGQQALLDKDHDLQVTESPDTASIIAWKDGLFQFKSASIEEIMKQMARWYDVDVVYSGKISEHFVSTLPMDSSLFEGLHTLQKTGRVHFKAEGRTITVFPH
jgi:transmembrane sensor